jgi:ABC-type amino acid transport substrate-binding protein
VGADLQPQTCFWPDPCFHRTIRIHAEEEFMNKAYLVSCMAVAASLLSAPASADDLTGTLQKIKESGSITIGYRETSLPFSYIDDAQKPIGFASISATRSSMRSKRR